jgi:hypothetical protein
MPAGIGHIAETHMISPEARCRVSTRWRSVCGLNSKKCACVHARGPCCARAGVHLTLLWKRSSREKSSTVRDFT